MRKVAVVSPAPTSPTDFGNRKRIKRVTQALKDNGFSIHFVMFALEEPWRKFMPARAYAEMREDWDDFHVVIPTNPYHNRPAGADHTIDEWWDPALEKFLWWYLRAQQFDAVIVNYIYLSRALTLAPPGTMKILDTHDRFSGRREMLARLGIAPEFFHLNVEEEKRGLERADLVLAIKDEEKAYFNGLTNTPCLSLPYAEQPQQSSMAEPDPDGYLRIGLIGGRNNINRRSVEVFLERALPAFFRMGAPIQVVLAGTMCRDLERFQNNALVRMIGPVDDVSDFYDEVDLIAVPIEHSTGQKIKVAEAVANGRPTIALAHSFEGFTPTSPMHRCSSLDELVDRCITLSFDASQVKALGHASERSANIQEDLFQTRIGELATLIKDRPQSVIVVDGALLRDSHLAAPALFQIMSFLDEMASIRLLVYGEEQPHVSLFDAHLGKFSVERLATKDDVSAEVSLSDVIWSVGASFLREDIPETWSGLLVQSQFGRSRGADLSPGLRAGARTFVDVEEVGSGRIVYWRSSYPSDALDPRTRKTRGKIWTDAGQTAVVLLSPDVKGNAAKQTIDALLDIPWLQTIAVVAETDAAIVAARKRHPFQSEKLRSVDIDHARLDWPEKVVLGLDLSFGYADLACAASHLECSADTLYVGQKALVKDGRALVTGATSLEILHWIDAAGRGALEEARPMRSQDNLSESLRTLLKSRIEGISNASLNSL